MQRGSAVRSRVMHRGDCRLPPRQSAPLPVALGHNQALVPSARGRSKMPAPTEQLVPLCVDLDGTLVKTDMLMETMVRLIAIRPWLALALPVWLLKGRAHLKREIARRVSFDPALLPYDEVLLADLRRQRIEGRRLVLATAADGTVAQGIAHHLGIF